MSIHFGTGGWRAVIGDEFTRINIQRIATAVAYRMKLEKVQGFAIGYDRRFLSREAAIWFSEALAGQGVHVYFVNLSAPTPQIMYTVKTMNLPYGAMVTASHNPAIYNGIKLFTRGGRDAVQSVTDDVAAKAEQIFESELRVVGFDTAREQGIIEYIDPQDDYLDSIISQIDMKAMRTASRNRTALLI